MGQKPHCVAEKSFQFWVMVYAEEEKKYIKRINMSH